MKPMSDSNTPSPAAAIVQPRRKLPFIWILPIIALISAILMVYQTEFNKGPLITIEFDNAEGLQAGKTRIKSRSVDVGTVETIALNKDFSRAIIKARIAKPFVDLLKSDSELWIIKPRIGNDGISGMSTLLSGAYIEIKPGTSKETKLSFVALKSPPVLQQYDEKGISIRLQSEDASSISTGDPVLYKGFKVGTISSATFSWENRCFEYDAFIEEQYHDLLSDASRFWNASGININYGARGLKIQTSSLDALISGGVTFDLPEGSTRGNPVEEGHLFQLYPSLEDMLNQPFHHCAEYLLLFNTSIAGLSVGAPVEYRGIRIGSVTDISMHYLSANDAFNLTEVPIPVKIRIDPGRLHYEDSEKGVADIRAHMVDRIKFGARAYLAIGSLLTGSQYVAFEYIPNAEKAEIGHLGDFEILPTVNRGFNQIEDQVTQLLEKLNSLELGQTLTSMNQTLTDVRTFLEHFNETLTGLDAILADEKTRSLPSTLTDTLNQVESTLSGLDPDSPIYQQLEATLANLSEASREFSNYLNILNNKPNAIIFSDSNQKDPIPPASK